MRSLMEAVPYENLSIGRSSESSFQLIYFVAENLLSVFNFLSYIYVKFHIVTESSLYTLSAGVIHTANKDTTPWLCQVVTYKAFPDVSKSCGITHALESWLCFINLWLPLLWLSWTPNVCTYAESYVCMPKTFLLCLPRWRWSHSKNWF